MKKILFVVGTLLSHAVSAQIYTPNRNSTFKGKIEVREIKVTLIPIIDLVFV